MRQKFYPAGRCIFCADDFTDETGLLTDEHIIAFSLGGNEVLPKATCTRHQKITAKFEEQVSANMFHVYRHVNNLPSRTGKDNQPYSKIPIENTETGICFNLEIPVAESPCLYIVPSFWPPGLIDDRPDGPGRYGTLRAAFDDKSGGFMKTLPPSARIKQLVAGGFSDAFYRMLAKTAHTFLTGEVGQGNFTPTLLKLIEGDTKEWFQLVGGFDPPSAQERESLSFREVVKAGVSYWVVSVSLSLLPELPRYQIVTGIRKEPMPFPNRTRQARDAASATAREARRALALENGTFGKKRTR